MRTNLGVITCLIGIAAIPATAQENYSTWAQSRAIRVNTTATGANVPGDVLEFPLLIRLNASNFPGGFAQAAGNGRDVRFTWINGTDRLPHQIERWDSAGQSAEIWVRTFAVRGNDSAIALRMYWGRAGVADSSQGARVFSRAAGFGAVFHMNETDTIRDAGPLGLKGVPVGATLPQHVAPSAGPYISGGHKNFSAPGTETLNTGGGYRIATASGGTSAGALNYTADSAYTISAWVNMNSFPGSGTTRRGIVTKTELAQASNGAGGVIMQYHLRGLNPTNNFEFADGSSNGVTGVAADAGITTAQWNYVAYSRSSPASAVFYVYNAAGTAVADPAEGGNNTQQNVDVFFGGFAGTGGPGAATGSGYFDGKLDEVTFANRARDASWVKLSYETQKPGSAVLKFTTDPVVALRPGQLSPLRGVTLIRSAGGLMVRLPADLAGEVELSIVDPAGRKVWGRALETGSRAAAWNGLGAEGRSAGHGVYFLRVSVAGRAWGAQAFTYAP